MTSPTAVDIDDGDGWSTCWCCGTREPETGLLRLGAHPEAAVCLACVAHLRQRARAHDNPRALNRSLHLTANR